MPETLRMLTSYKIVRSIVALVVLIFVATPAHATNLVFHDVQAALFRSGPFVDLFSNPEVTLEANRERTGEAEINFLLGIRRITPEADTLFVRLSSDRGTVERTLELAPNSYG